MDLNRSGVYIIKNLVNGKVYVGSAVNLHIRRQHHFKDNGVNKYHNQYLNNAFTKHGVDSFEFEILEYCEKEDLINVEQKYIDMFDVCNRDKGYNIQPTAGSPLGAKHTITTRIKLSGLRKGEKNPMYGKNGSDNPTSRTVVQLSKNGKYISEFGSIIEATTHTGSKDVSSCCYGKRRTSNGFRWIFKEDYEKLNGNIPELEPYKNSKAIVQLTLDGDFIREFISGKEAKEQTNISRPHISQVCNGKRKTAGGYRWIYKDEYEKLNGNILKLKQNKCSSKSIIQLSKDGELINKFKSISEAERQTGINNSNISQCCQCKYKTAGGYIWKYEEDYLNI